MTTYRAGNHWGVTIVAETELGPAATGAQLVAVVVNGDQALAERICALLNDDEPKPESEWSVGAYRIYSRWVRADVLSSKSVHAAIQEAYALGLASDAPSAPAISPQAAQNGPAVPSATPGGLSGSEAPASRWRCNTTERCFRPDGHDGFHGFAGSPPASDAVTIPLAESRFARGGRIPPPNIGPGCICNDPPPTVDKPKNGTASRPDGWACPRHGAVI